MKIAFIQKQSYVKLSCIILSAVLKEAGYDKIEVFIEDLDKKKFYQSLFDYSPNIVIASFYLGAVLNDVKILQKIKKNMPDIKTIVGGPFFMLSLDLLKNDGIDIIIKGDGEKSLLEVVKAIDNNETLENINGVSFKINTKEIYNNKINVTKCINTLPKMDHDLYYTKYHKLSNNFTKPFIRNRGCPFKCTFCGTGYLTNQYKKEFNLFRIDDNHKKTIDEIKYVKEKYGLKWVQFHDGTFNASKIDTIKFLSEYKKENLPPFVCNIRVENIDYNLVKLFKEAKCDRVTLGIQTGAEHLKKISGRLTPNEIIIKTMSWFREFKIRIGIDIIIGWPSETIEDVWETIYLTQKVKPDYVSLNQLILFPNTDIEKYAFKNKFINRHTNIEDIFKLEKGEKSEILNIKISREMKNMVKLFEFAVIHPKLEKFIKIMAKLPDNHIFTLFKNYRYIIRILKYDNLSLSMKFKRLVYFLIKGS